MAGTRTPSKIPIRNKLEAAGFLLVFLAALVGGWLWAEWSC